jgi:methylthioxylose transferase
VGQRLRAGRRGPFAVTVGGAVFVAAVAAWGHWLEAHGTRLHLTGGQPLAGRWDPRLPALALLPLLLGAVLLWWAPRYAQRLTWRRLLSVSFVCAAAWAVALALVDGPRTLAEPLTTRWEYLADVDRVGVLGPFLATFTDHVRHVPGQFQWATHVSGHPPGALLAFVGLDRLGLGAPGWAAALCIVAGASAVPAVLATTKLLGGESVARRAAPFLVLSPTALWVATSADAVFLGVSAWGVCALAHAAARPDRAGDPLALAGGVLLGAALFLSYGLVLVGLLAVAVVVVRRRFRPLAVGAVGVAAVVGWVAHQGFWWGEGLAVAAARVREGPIWIDRPWAYFAAANLAAVAIAVGPGVLGGAVVVLRSARERLTGPLGRAAVLPAAAVAAIVLAIASGLSKGEVERIYLPFTLWLLTVTAALPGRYRRGWLAAQVAVALAVQLGWRLWW